MAPTGWGEFGKLLAPTGLQIGKRQSLPLGCMDVTRVFKDSF
jgi:hypothetical protein